MKLQKMLAPLLGLCLLLSACGSAGPAETIPTTTAPATTAPATTATKPKAPAVIPGAVAIALSDEGITVDGQPVSTDETAAVYTARDIVYYESGKDFTYGEGTASDAHTRDEADAHTVVHIAQPGTYAISGNLSTGQIAVDLGENAKDDPEAVVTLVLNGMDINCSVAPAVIFYNVYECGTADASAATMEVDTTKAGANVVIADGTENMVNGAYVAKIYKSVELNEAGTEVVTSKKLHKYDGAFYSKMSMNILGGEKGDGKLIITAANEGLGTELHLTLLGGNITICSGNDGINTNEDNVSVTAIRGGTLDIAVTGQTGEGDGIDSNGWLVIDGGTVTASACGISGDAGVDADKGVYIRGGTVVASGNMLDHFQAEQTSLLFSFSPWQSGGEVLTLKQGEKTLLTAQPVNDFQYLILSAPDLAPGTYQLYRVDTQLMVAAGGTQGGRPMGGQMPEGMEPPERPEGMTPPEGMGRPEKPEGMTPPMGNPQQPGGEASGDFTITKGYNAFTVINTEK